MMKWTCRAAVMACLLCLPLVSPAAVLDLTTRGSSGTLNDARYFQVDPHSTGTGVIDAFLRVQRDGVEQGYNTDYKKLEFDEKSGSFTHSLMLSDVPRVNIEGAVYREFLLDINENNSGADTLLSLDSLRIFLGGAGDLHNYPTGLGRLVYDIDSATSDNWIKLDYDLGTGSGSGDMFAYIPNSLFTGEDQYVYLYSKFGEQGQKSNGLDSSDGFEEWAVRKGGAETDLPEPSTALLVAAGFLPVAAAALRRRR